MPELNPWGVAVFTIVMVVIWDQNGFTISPTFVLLSAGLVGLIWFACGYAYDYWWACREERKQHGDIP